MMANALMINGDRGEVLSVSLLDILNCIEMGSKYKWSILWLEAVGKPMDNSVLKHEQEIKNSNSGLRCGWDELSQLSIRFDQINEILLIGDENETKLKRYKDDNELYNSCCFIIELIDSSYWIVRSRDENFLNKIKKTLTGVEETHD